MQVLTVRIGQQTRDLESLTNIRIYLIRGLGAQTTFYRLAQINPPMVRNIGCATATSTWIEVISIEMPAGLSERGVDTTQRKPRSTEPLHSIELGLQTTLIGQTRNALELCTREPLPNSLQKEPSTCSPSQAIPTRVPPLSRHQISYLYSTSTPLMPENLVQNTRDGISFVVVFP